MSNTRDLLPPSSSSSSSSSPAAPSQAHTDRMWSALPAGAATETFGAVDDKDLVAGFRVGRVLGQGGMATVYEAVHVASGQKVALKRVREDARKDPQFIERFLREVRAASRLDHKNICRVFAGGDDGKDVFMAVELLEGGDLDQLLKRAGGALPAAAAAEIVGQLLEALEHAHAAGLVHRDIKPANVMLTKEGVVKLVDFGIARSNDDQKLTATGIVVGTPAYMSPEQARGGVLDGRSDLFSVGVMFAELLMGRNLFQGDTATATVMKILTETPPPLVALDPTVPRVVSIVVEGLLQRDPARRYASARAALDDLAAYRRIVDVDQPHLLRACLDDAVATARALRQAQARFEAERAADLLGLGDIAWPAAALALHRAVRLDDSEPAYRTQFVDVCARGGFDFAPADPRIAEVEATIARSALQPALLKRAADLHRAAKNPAGTAAWLARYLQANPHDELAWRQYAVLASGPPPSSTAPASTSSAADRARLSTREIVDGLKTGGFTAASNRTETTFRPIDALLPAEPRERPAPPKPAPKPLAGARVEPQVVVVHEAGGGVPVGAIVAVCAVVVAAAVVFGVARDTKRALKDGQRAEAAALGHHLDADPELKVQAMDALNKARAACARKDGGGAIDNADIALNFAQLDPDEQLSALYFKACGEAVVGDRAGARDTITRYLKSARLDHERHDEAVALEQQLRSR